MMIVNIFSRENFIFWSAEFASFFFRQGVLNVLFYGDITGLGLVVFVRRS